MIITVSFEIKNKVQVMEGWPIKLDDKTFFLEMEKDVLKRVCISFHGVGIEHAPSLTMSDDTNEISTMKISGDEYVKTARNLIINWQAVLSGLQILNIDYDNFGMRFLAESVEEEPFIHLKSFSSSYDGAINYACDFEYIGRAFCADTISGGRIESTAHFRDGRIAFEAGRYVDAYNSMFLFIETRYCDGKTQASQQIDLLLKNDKFCKSLEKNSADLDFSSLEPKAEKFDLFKPSDNIKDKIKSIILLRGKLRHHSLKSPLRWDPNKQDDYKGAARFLSIVVGEIVTSESIEDIYSQNALKSFRDISVSTGFETKLKLTTQRLENERFLVLDISYPTTIISSRLCINTVRNAVEACQQSNQLADTVSLEATHEKNHLEIFSLRFGVWAYTKSRTIDVPINSVKCAFEHFKSGAVVRNEFTIPINSQLLRIIDVWKLLIRVFDHIEERDPRTRIMNLRLFINKGEREILIYRVGAHVKN